MPTKAEETCEQIVAMALVSISGGGDWDALDPEEQGLMIEAARGAIIAHHAWLDAAGFRIIPPGMTVRPQSEMEAHEMAKQVRAYLDQPMHAKQRRNGLMGSPKLILPYDA
jgi:hypothetical protein